MKTVMEKLNKWVHENIETFYQDDYLRKTFGTSKVPKNERDVETIFRLRGIGQNREILIDNLLAKAESLVLARRKRIYAKKLEILLKKMDKKIPYHFRQLYIENGIETLIKFFRTGQLNEKHLNIVDDLLYLAKLVGKTEKMNTEKLQKMQT